MAAGPALGLRWILSLCCAVCTGPPVSGRGDATFHGPSAGFFLLLLLEKKIFWLLSILLSLPVFLDHLFFLIERFFFSDTANLRQAVILAVCTAILF